MKQKGRSSWGGSWGSRKCRLRLELKRGTELLAKRFRVCWTRERRQMIYWGIARDKNAFAQMFFEEAFQ